jgi:hypothetical protein
MVAPKVSLVHIPTKIVVLAKKTVLPPEITLDDPWETVDTGWEEDDRIQEVRPWLIDQSVVMGFVWWKE